MALGTDLRVQVNASDGDGIKVVKLYPNGLRLAGEKRAGAYVWRAASAAV